MEEFFKTPTQEEIDTYIFPKGNITATGNGECIFVDENEKLFDPDTIGVLYDPNTMDAHPDHVKLMNSLKKKVEV